MQGVITKIYSDNFLIKLIKNNTGYSSKNFFLIAVTIIGSVLLTMPVIAIIVELINTGTVTMSWSDIAMYVGAVFSGFTGAGIAKAWSEKYERLPGPDGILGTADDVYVKRGSAYEYTDEPSNNHSSEDSYMD